MKELVEDLWPYDYRVINTTDRILELLSRLIMKANKSGLDGVEVASVAITSEENDILRITTDMKVGDKVFKIRDRDLFTRRRPKYDT